MRWSRLNVFQQLTRQWDTLHPYNAGQMMKLAGTPDPQRLARLWTETLAQLGLGAVRIAGRRFGFEPLQDVARCSELVHIPPRAGVEDVLSDHLNRPFHRDADLPFRPFILSEPDGYWAGVIYHHWVADSFSIRLLLREWFLRLHDPAAAQRTPLALAAQGYWRLFGPGAAGWRLDSGVIDTFGWSARLKRARRIEDAAFGEFRTAFTLHRLPDGLIEPLLRSARRRGVTLNDVFLAAVAEACDQLVPAQRTARRRELALGTIVDLRAGLADAAQRSAFGLYLGFTNIICRPRDLAGFDRLLDRIALQNRRLKSARAAEASLLRMFGGLVVARLLRTSRLMEFYRKRLPLAGGISNVNLNRDWPARYHPWPLLDYVRISPCGPMMPVVFTPTTLGSALNFGLTCRESIIPAGLAGQLAGMFAERLTRFAGS